VTRTFLVRGLLAGLFAGLVGFGFALVFGEPNVDAAIALEGVPAETPLVSRDLQSTAGLLTASLGYGLAIGGLFGLLSAVAYGRMGRLGPRASSALLAGAAFTAVILVPFLKYPANPPAVGHPDTINERTSLYLILMAVSLLLAWVSVLTGRALAPRLGAWNAALAGGGIYLGSMLVAGLVMPRVDEVGEDFPASLLYDFRVSSLVIQVAIWTTLGLVFGYLSDRDTHGRAARRPGVVKGDIAEQPTGVPTHHS